MKSPWTYVHKHRNPDHPELRGYWPSEADAREYRGLMLIPFYDPHRGCILGGWWELRHRLSNDPILFIRTDDEETAEEYGAKVAEMAHWDHMRKVPEWTAPPHSYELIEYLKSTYQIFYEPNFEAIWSKPASAEENVDDWERDIPYGR